MSLLLLASLLQPPADPMEANRLAKWEKDIVAIEKRLAARPIGAGGIFFAGSSSVVKWDLDKSFPGRGYVNVGFGGSVVRDSTFYTKRIVTPYKPATVVFYAGDNDIAAGRTPGQVAADFKAFCVVVHGESPKCRILFVSIKPSVARWQQFDLQTRANELVKKDCAEDDRIAYVDIVALMLGADGTPAAELFEKDGLHLSPAGYAKWTGAVTAVLGK